MTEIKRDNFIFIMSSPSGAGKTSIAKRLLSLNNNLKLSISVTTRAIREGEINGIDYHFVDELEFNNLVKEDKFIEYASVFGNYYGTLKSTIDQLFGEGNDILFDVDWQGAKTIKSILKSKTVSLFILPPSMKELEYRLKKRNLDNIFVIDNRMNQAKSEISHYLDYDYIVINDNLDDSIIKVNSILLAERLNIKRQIGIDQFICDLIEV